jgi:hypothetical protein
MLTGFFLGMCLRGLVVFLLGCFTLTTLDIS